MYISLSFRILSVFVPISFLIVLVVFGASEYRRYQELKTDVITDLENFTQSQVAPLSALMWVVDKKSIREIVAGFSHEPDFQYAIVRDANDNDVASSGVVPTDNSFPTVRLSHDLFYNNFGTLEKVGEIEVSFHFKRVNQTVMDSALNSVGLLAVVLVLSYALLAVLTRRFVERPLKEMQASFENADIETLRDNDGAQSDNDFSRLAKAYSQMLERRLEKERAHLSTPEGHGSEIAEAVESVKRSEELLRESETRFRTMVDSVGDAIYIHDRFGKLYDINPAACEQTGYSRAELLALNVAQLDVGVDFDNLRDTWDLGEADPEQYPITLLSAHRRKDGSEFPIEVRISLLPSGDGYLYVAVVRDITERTAVELELSDKMRELDFQKSALDEHAIVSIADVRGLITYVNDKFCVMSGYGREELIGQNHRILKSDEHSPEFYADLWGTISSGKPWRGEIKNLKKGGHDFYWVDATIVPFTNEKGVPFQYVAIRTDITERVMARQAAEEANRAKSEFLSSMSHELRTPLNAIVGFSQLLETDPDHPLNEDQLESVEQIKKGGEHLLGLINEILDLAKIESGRLSISIEDVVPNDVLDSCVNMTRELGKKNGIEVVEERAECLVSSAPHSVRVDQNRLRQVLLNLMSNAVKYNIHGGKVTLKTELRDNGRMRFSVTDTGNGISAAGQEELFLPFHRLDAEGSNIEGTGIGLTITKELVELMGGEIGVSSEVGSGSTFWVEFVSAAPVAVKTEAQAPTPKDMVLKSGDAEVTVLYVEDNPANVKLMGKVFQRLANVNLLSAHNAEIGLVMAEKERPGLILMDINLPGMNGVEAFEELKKSDTLRDIPVIAVSANAMAHDIEKALSAGFKGYITKPFQIDDILDVVSKYL